MQASKAVPATTPATAPPPTAERHVQLLALGVPVLMLAAAGILIATHGGPAPHPVATLVPTTAQPTASATPSATAQPSATPSSVPTPLPTPAATPAPLGQTCLWKQQADGTYWQVCFNAPLLPVFPDRPASSASPVTPAAE